MLNCPISPRSALSGPCYAHRIRPNFEQLVACTSQVYRLDGGGAVMQTYQLPGIRLLFALIFLPDGKTFWTADYYSGSVFRVDIASGNVVTQFNAGVLSFLSGLSVVGEITAATATAPLSTDSFYVGLLATAPPAGQPTLSDRLHTMGAALAQRQITGTAPAEGVVALLFGRPRYDATTQTYGTTRWYSPSSLSDILLLVQDFAIGYYNALG